MDLPSDCRACGACCFSAAARYVVVTGSDWERLGPEAERFAEFDGHRATMRMRDSHCAALIVHRRANGAREFFCTVYERRPQICRDLGRGSPQCDAEREMKAALAAGS